MHIDLLLTQMYLIEKQNIFYTYFYKYTLLNIKEN